MDIRPDDVIIMKKPHPCGGNRFRILRVGMDFRLRCETCGHEMMVSRVRVEKSLRILERKQEP